jgi:hypothetical protein
MAGDAALDIVAQKEPDRSREPGRTEEEERDLQLASEGAGPLLQRDYVAVVDRGGCPPEEAIRRLRNDFPRYSPELLASFRRPEGAAGPLAVGDTMHVHIRGAGPAGVIVTGVEPSSLTLRTLEGHQEAGVITFAAHRDETGRLVLRIRSRARQRNLPRFFGYALLGKTAQTQIWVQFLKALVADCAGHLVGDVIVATDEVEETPLDRGEEEKPTIAVPEP